MTETWYNRNHDFKNDHFTVITSPPDKARGVALVINKNKFSKVKKIYEDYHDEMNLII